MSKYVKWCLLVERPTSGANILLRSIVLLLILFVFYSLILQLLGIVSLMEASLNFFATFGVSQVGRQNCNEENIT